MIRVSPTISSHLAESDDEFKKVILDVVPEHDIRDEDTSGSDNATFSRSNPIGGRHSLSLMPSINVMKTVP
jgi:hypothetical protein